MAPCVIIRERAAEILRTEHGLQIAIMAETSRGAVPSASRTPSKPERVLV
jgi:hypothetical protein